MKIKILAKTPRYGLPRWFSLFNWGHPSLRDRQRTQRKKEEFFLEQSSARSSCKLSGHLGMRFLKVYLTGNGLFVKNMQTGLHVRWMTARVEFRMRECKTFTSSPVSLRSSELESAG